jgi:hypothetical protein
MFGMDKARSNGHAALFALTLLTPCALATPSNVPASGEADKQQLSEWLRSESDAPPPTLITLAWRATDGVTPSSFALYLKDEHAWRWNTQSLGANGEVVFLDHARSPEGSWKLSPEWLVRLPAAGRPDLGHPVDDLSEQFRTTLGFFASGGLQLMRGATIETSTLKDGVWSVTASASGIVMRVSGRWDEDRHRGFVEQFSSGLTTVRFGKWRWHDSIRMWLAERMDVDAGGQRIHYDFVDCGTLTEASFDAVVHTPDVGGVDPVRGPLTRIGESDYRVEQPFHRSHGSRGGNVISDAELQRKLRVPEQYLRWLGWSAGCTVLSFVTYIRVTRSSKERLV